MTVRELITELSRLEDLDATVNLVAGVDDGNCDIFTDPITIQEGVDTDTNEHFVEICSFSFSTNSSGAI